jgi:hypothetical protein
MIIGKISKEIKYNDIVFPLGALVKMLSKAEAFDKDHKWVSEWLAAYPDDGSIFVVFMADPFKKLRVIDPRCDGAITMVQPLTYKLCLKNVARWVFSSPKTYLLFPVIPFVAAVDYYEAQDTETF